MNEIKQRLLHVALEFKDLHGVFFAACFLRENGVDLATAINVLAAQPGGIANLTAGQYSRPAALVMNAACDQSLVPTPTHMLSCATEIA
jgi:hypothetical protein